MSPIITCPDWKTTKTQDKVTHNHGDTGGGLGSCTGDSESQVSIPQPSALGADQAGAGTATFYGEASEAHVAPPEPRVTQAAAGVT